MNALKKFFMSISSTTPIIPISKPKENNYVQQELARRASVDFDRLNLLADPNEEENDVIFGCETEIVCSTKLSNLEDLLFDQDSDFLDADDATQIAVNEDPFLNKYTGEFDPPGTGGDADPTSSQNHHSTSLSGHGFIHDGFHGYELGH